KWVLILAIAVAFLQGLPDLRAQPTGKNLVRLINIIPIAGDAQFYPDRLDEVYFSIQNRSEQPLDWVKIQIIVRNPSKEVIDTKDAEIDLAKYYGKPLAPGDTKQMSQLLFIRGY